MGEKSIWHGIENLMGGLAGTKPRSKTLATIEQRCPVCSNALDPAWTKCPYCEAAQKASTKSSGVGQQPAMASGQSPRRATVVDTGAPAQPAGAAVAAMTSDSVPGRRQTIVDPGLAPGADGRTGGGRRIMGILTTFTWSPQGKLFPILDGRNYVGAGALSADSNRPCDVQVSEDRAMSSEHFLILCQSGRYTVYDSRSTNGTFLNGVQIGTSGAELPDNAVIKSGTTLFMFQKVRFAGAASTEPGHGGDMVWRPEDREATGTLRP